MKSKSLDCAIMKSIRTALIFPARTEVIKCESMFILKTAPPRVICTEPRIKELAVLEPIIQPNSPDTFLLCC